MADSRTKDPKVKATKAYKVIDNQDTPLGRAMRNDQSFKKNFLPPKKAH